MEKSLAENLSSANSLPICENLVIPFNEEMKGKVTSQVRSAYQYYLTSNDPSAGSDYDERIANFQIKSAKTFQAFMSARRAEYRKTRCRYYATIKANAGDTKTGVLVAESGFHFIPSTIDRTTSGEWKGGPSYVPNEIEPTSFSWVTGGNRSTRTYVYISAKYIEEFIKNMILEEVRQAKKDLNDLGIPVDLPPFLDE